MPKVPRKQIEEYDIYSWEDQFGTETLFYSEEYEMMLPYWVKYMPEKEKKEYVARINKDFDF